MYRTFRRISSLCLLMLFSAACSASGADPVSSAARAVGYQDVLGRSMTDQVVLDFLRDNNCSRADQFQLCNDLGMMLWANSSQVVETVYLYLNNVDGFAGYRGELPFGLKFYDIMEAVEYKLARQGVGNSGLPDQSSSPDHFHYWASYDQANMIIVYNSPFADGDASIYAILVSN